MKLPAEKVAAPRPTSTTLDTAELSLSERTERRTPEMENTAMKAGPARTLRESGKEMFSQVCIILYLIFIAKARVIPDTIVC